VLHRGAGEIVKENLGGRTYHTVNNNRKAKYKRVVPVCKKRGTPESSWSYAITLVMSAKRPKGRWVVYEQRKGKFILLSRFFTTRPQAEKERDRLEAAFTYKKVSFGVGLLKE